MAAQRHRLRRPPRLPRHPRAMQGSHTHTGDGEGSRGKAGEETQDAAKGAAGGWGDASADGSKDMAIQEAIGGASVSVCRWV